MKPCLRTYRPVIPLLLGLVFLRASGDAADEKAAGAQTGGAAPGVADARLPVGAPRQPGGGDAGQPVAVTNQVSASQQAQAELIQKLLTRIAHLEAKDTAQSASALKAHDEHLQLQEEQVRRLVDQIGELERKVNALQATRVSPEGARATDDGPTTRELDQKIQAVARANELAAEAAEERAREMPKLSVGAGGFSLSSADTNFTLRLKGDLQLDSRTFFADSPFLQGNDSFVLRRARPILEGTVYRDFDFQFVPDFGGSTVQIFDAWLNYRYRPELQLRAGKFKGPVGFENLQSDATLPFNERSMVSALVPNRSVGVQLWGDIAGGAASYAAGLFNSAGDSRNPGTSDFSDEREYAGRLSAQPFKNTGLRPLQGIGLGLGGSYSEAVRSAQALPGTTGGTLPGYSTVGQQQFFAYNPAQGSVVAEGAHWRVSPYASYLWGPFGVLGEYALSHQGVLNTTSLVKTGLDHTAWQVSAQWVLTGEPASFNGIVPDHPFDPRNGGWGAWQLVGRYGEFGLDDHAFPAFANPASSASGAKLWSVGLNWWLNKRVRVLASFARTTFEGGGLVNPAVPATLVPPATVTHQHENVFFTRLQLTF